MRKRDKEFSAKRRETLAKQGKAMPGGGFPIENRSDLENAIKAFGRAKNPGAAGTRLDAALWQYQPSWNHRNAGYR